MLRELSRESLDREIAHRHDRFRRGENFLRAYGEIPGCEDVVGMRSQAKVDPEKAIDPVGGSGGESGEMGMDAGDSFLAQAQPDVRCLVEAKKVGLPAPVSQRTDCCRRKCSSLCSAVDLFHQLALPRQIDDATQYLFVPILPRLARGLPNGIDRDLRSLTNQL